MPGQRGGAGLDAIPVPIALPVRPHEELPGHLGRWTPACVAKRPASDVARSAFSGPNRCGTLPRRESEHSSTATHRRHPNPWLPSRRTSALVLQMKGVGDSISPCVTTPHRTLTRPLHMLAQNTKADYGKKWKIRYTVPKGEAHEVPYEALRVPALGQYWLLWVHTTHPLVQAYVTTSLGVVSM